MIWLGIAVVIEVGAGACGSSRGVTPAAPSAKGVDAHGEIARLEVMREVAVDRLIELAGDGETRAVRLVALRALARAATPEAIAFLRAALSDPDGEIRRQAAWAAGITESGSFEPGLIALYRASAGDRETRATVLIALGRVGSPSALPVFIEALGDPQLAEPASRALGRYGRRQIALDESTRAALVAAGREALQRPAAIATRFAVGFALSREHEPSPDAGVMELLVSLAGPLPAGDRSSDSSGARAEARAMALRALARRDPDPRAAAVMVEGLQARDWRVRLEAVRGLIRPGVSDENLAAFAAVLVREWAELGQRGWTGPHIHIIGEGLRALQNVERAASSPGDRVLHPAMKQAVDRLYRAAGENLREASTGSMALASSAVHCLTAALRSQWQSDAGEPSSEEPSSELRTCGQVAGGSARFHGDLMPEHERMAVIAAVAISRRDRGLPLLRELARHTDSRVRAVAMQVVADVDGAGITAEVRELLAAGLKDAAVEVAGSAVDALTRLARSDEEHARQLAGDLSGDLVRVAGRDRNNLELRILLLGALGATRSPGGEAICRDAHGHPNRSIRSAARGCLREYSGSDPGPATAIRPPTAPSRVPPVDPASVIGKRVTLTITTTRGEIVVRMDSDAAPWHVASIAHLVKKGFYRDLLWHRVVPNFVIQGGDPLGSGWGGPDFIIPAEPSSHSFVRGTVGIADAGFDTGGSQWFIMHSAAPHLDGRYTAIGQVVRGLEVVDRLIVGDRIRSAAVMIE